MKKIFVITILLLFGLKSYSQEFGFLYRTTLYPRASLPSTGHAGYHTLSGAFSVNYAPNGQSVNSIRSKYYPITNSTFNEITLYLRGGIEAIRTDDGGCSRNIESTITKNGFLAGENIYLGGCIGSTTVYSLHLQQPLDDDIDICNTKNINLQYGWNWQYRLIKDNATTEAWTNLPDLYQAQRTINLSLDDILTETDYQNLLRVQFRTGYGTEFLDPISYSYIPCPPILDPSINSGKPEVEDAKCFGNSNGGFTVTFDRTPFNNSEFFQIAITKKIGTIFSDSPDLTVNLFASNFSGNSYTYLGLSAGEYQIEWSVGNINNPELNPSGPVEFEIFEPDPLTFTTSQNNIVCEGDTNGSITFNPNGGNPPYRYSIDGGTTTQTSATFNGLTQGAYTLVLLDGNCISTPREENIIATNTKPYIDADQLIQPGEAPFYAATGSINLNSILGGDGNFSFVWTKDGNSYLPPNPENLTNLLEGIYSVTITDNYGSGCTSIPKEYIINAIQPLSVTFNEVQIIQCDGDTGTISAQVSGGTGNYSYLWSNNQTTQEINVAQGTYSIQVSDGVTTINQDYTFNYLNPLLTVSETHVNNSCFNGDQGSINLLIEGGNGSYSVSWDDNPTTDQNRTGLTQGFYTYSITDGVCTITNNGNPIEITSPSDPFEITLINSSNPTTNMGTDGSIEVNVIGGASPLQYEWSGTNITNSSATNILTDLGDGNYTIVVTDALGCSVSLVNIPIKEPGPLTILGFSAIDRCNGINNGSLTATADGTGEIIYDFILEDGSPNGSNLRSITTLDRNLTIGNLPSGSYSLNLTEINTGIQVRSSAAEIQNIIELQPIMATITATDINCDELNSGTITITAITGGNPFNTGSGYQYKIDDGFDTFQNQPLFENLPAKIYTVTIRDANGCEMVTTAEVKQLIPPTLDADNTIIAGTRYVGDNGGYISLAFTNQNSSEFSYLWSGPNVDGVITKDLTGLYEGTYRVFISSPGNCNTDLVFNINDPGELTIAVQQTIFLNCNAETTGEITADVQGGVLNYTYEWHQILNGNDSILSETTNILGNLPAGSYYTIVTDANAVTRTSSTIIITQPEELVATLNNKVDVLCNGEATGSINVTVTGGTAPYTFYWNNALSTQNLDALPAGDYYFDVIDANGCSDQLEVTIEAPTNPLSISTQTVVDASEYQATDGSISIELSGGAPAYTILWTKISDTAFTSNENSINNLTAGDYQVLVTDTNGCSLTETFTVNQPDIIEETITAPICAGGTDGSISLIVNKGNGIFSYSWNTGATTPDINNLSAGEYTVLITGFDAPISRTYVVEDPLPIQINLGEDRVLCEGQVLTLDATVENLDATYMWVGDNGFSSAKAIVTLSERGSYTLNISTATGCTVTGTITIDVSDEEISAELAVSSQVFVGESLILVDISYPLPESMEWIIPDNVTIITSTTDEAEITFDTPGEYEIGIITQRGPCTEIQTKKVLVLNTDPTVNAVDTENGQKLIEDFILYPNPTSGVFNAQITMSEVGAISIKVFSFANNNQIALVKEKGKATYDIPFDISIMPAGVYAVLLETPYGTSLRKIIIK